MSEPLALAFRRSFSRVEEPGSPDLEIGQSGLRIRVEELDFDGGTASFALHCTYKLSDAFTECFADVSHALVLFVEDPRGGRGAATALVDPFLIFYPMSAPSFLASRGLGGNPDTLVGGWVNAVVEARGFLPQEPPTLYARLSLQALVSPALELRFGDRTVDVHA